MSLVIRRLQNTLDELIRIREKASKKRRRKINKKIIVLKKEIAWLKAP